MLQVHSGVIKEHGEECVSAREDWFFAVLAVFTMACLHGLLCGFRYFDSDAIVQIPQILRKLDPSFCSRDFFLNANDIFSPRQYFVIAMAALSRLMPLPHLYFGLTILNNALIALVTYFFTDRVVNRGRLAPLIACAIVLAVESIAPGHAAHLNCRYTVPAAVAKPLVLLSLWLALDRRFVLGTIAAVAGSIFHPLLGIVTGAVALAAGGAAALIPALTRDGDRRAAWAMVGRAAACMVGLAIASWLLWFRHYEQNLIDSELFVDILARLRAPALYVPSEFFPVRVIDAALFLVAATISFVWYRAHRPDRRPLVRGIAAAAIIVLLMQVGGYLFVEVWPVRQWAALQAARFMFIPKWLGIVLIAATITRLWARGGVESAGGWLMLAAGGRTHGAGLLVGHLTAWLARRRGEEAPPQHVGLAIGLAFVLAGGLIAWGGNAAEPALLALLLSYALAVLSVRTWQARAGVSAAAVGIIWATLTINATHPLPIVGEGIDEAGPKFDVEAVHADLVGVADYARTMTPVDALFIGPPERPAFRTMARRALVVDFWSIPFSDRGMLEWYRRIEECYAPFPNRGASGIMTENWRVVSRERLASIARQYDADYALLYVQTDTDLSTLYADETFRLVDLGPLK